MATTVGPAAGLAAAADALLNVEWWALSDGDLGVDLLALERQAARLEAARLRLLAEADRRRLGVGLESVAGAPGGATSTAAWAARRAGWRPEQVGERVARAVALSGPLAATGMALAAGDLTADHAAVVHRTMTKLPTDADAAMREEAEAFLVEHAALLDPRQLACAGRVLRHRLDREAGEILAREEDAAVERSEVRYSQADDGTWLLSGILDAVSGATVAAALDALSAPASVAQCGGVRDRRSAPQRRAEALVHLADTWLASQTGTESRPRLVVTVPAATVTHPTALVTAPGVLTGEAPVSAATVGVLACDAEVVPVLISAEGQPLDVGRTVYAFPDRIRRVIQVRDGGCTYRGCSRPVAWCQIHHLTAYSEGGSTSERNGTCLCGYHHRLVHRQGWRGKLTGTQVVWHPPGRSSSEVPPPPWLLALDRLVQRWATRDATAET